MNSLKLTADNQTDVRLEYNPDTMMTNVMLEGPSMWPEGSNDEVIVARLTPDQVRSLVMFATSNDPGDKWTTSPLTN